MGGLADQVTFVGVAGTAGKTAAASLLAAMRQAAGLHAGLYCAGGAAVRPYPGRRSACGRVIPPRQSCCLPGGAARLAAELAAAARCFGAAGCALAVVELPDAGLASALPQMPVCAVTAIGPDGVSRSIERSAALAAGALRKGLYLRHSAGAAKAALSELIVAAGRCDCELVVPDPEDITFLEAGKVRQPGGSMADIPPLAFGPPCRRQRCCGRGDGAGSLAQGFEIPG